MIWKMVLAVFVFSNVADASLTIYGIERDILYEANPVIAWVINRLGLYPAVFITKTPVCIAGAWLYWVGSTRTGRERIFAGMALIFTMAVGFSIVIKQIIMLRTAGF